MVFKKPIPPPGYYIIEGKEVKCKLCKKKIISFIKYKGMKVCMKCWKKENGYNR